MTVLRRATAADAQAILELRLANRPRLEPYEPDAEDEEALELHPVEAGTRPENIASHCVLQRYDVTCVGLLRRHVLIGGEWRDHLLWERLAVD